MSILFNGFVLGWSVAWPPGPINAEIIRRGLLPRNQGGGFWTAWQVGLGACTGDFLWALAVAAGAGALLNKPGVRNILGVVSLALLLFLAAIFSRAAWRTAHRAKDVAKPAKGGQLLQKRHANGDETNRRSWATQPIAPIGCPSDAKRVDLAEMPKVTRSQGGYLLGLLFALSSPWNIGFWLAVVGSQQTVMTSPSFLNSLVLACAVVLGAVTWTIVLCVAVRSGARIFARPMWQAWTQALTAAVMVYFAAKLALQLLR